MMPRPFHRALLTLLAQICAAAFALLLVAPALAQPQSPPEETSASADVISVQEIARIEGQGESVLRGIGLVTGLKGTGDQGTELVMARALSRIYENNGNPLPDLKDLAKAKSVAIVMIEITVPSQGARHDDGLDVHVTVSHSASSLVGGRLYLSPLSGPLPGQGVFAMASGPIVIEDPANPTVGVIRGGGRIIRDILMPGITDSFTLVLKPPFRHFTVADQLSDTINSLAPEPDPIENAPSASVSALARAQDDVAVRIEIPEAERASPTKFIAKVMSATFSPSLLRLPAQVVVNSRTGSIIVTGNVELSAIAIAHKDLVITTTTPTPIPNQANPIVTAQKWTGLQTGGRPSERARVQDLIQAFKQLDIPIQEQINILSSIHKTGRLHAELIVE